MNIHIDHQAARNLLDDHLAKYLDAAEYEIQYLEASRLLTSNRLDIAIKILYLEMKAIEDVEFAQNLYIEHIRAFSLGSFSEPGNEAKVGIGKYLEDFDRCYDSIRQQGFDESKSIVPLSEDGSIANGAHRIASAYLAGVPVPTVRLSSPAHRYDASFFLGRGMSRDMVETAVTRFIECAENCYIAMVWPSAIGHDDELLRIIPDLVYRTEIDLDYNGAHNLISQIYYSETWLGSRQDNFPGARAKLVECFRHSGPLRVIAFQASSLAAVQVMKDEIRDLFGLGKHSVHISDTKTEAVRIARILFNRNSVHFLKHGKPNRFPSAINGVNRFKTFLQNNHMSPDRALVDSSHVLAVYGLRESVDLDYLALDEASGFDDDLIRDHAQELVYHGRSKGELVFNKENYFYFEDVKFVSFEQLYRMKRNRAETKDRNDLIMMDALIEKNRVKSYLGLLRQKGFYLRAMLKMRIIALLRLLGLYNAARYIYRQLRKRQGSWRGQG